MLTQIDTLKRGKDLGVKENCYIVLKYQAVEEKMDITNLKKNSQCFIAIFISFTFLNTVIISLHCYLNTLSDVLIFV